MHCFLMLTLLCKLYVEPRSVLLLREFVLAVPWNSTSNALSFRGYDEGCVQFKYHKETECREKV